MSDTPESRAEAAARDLADTGQSVTARAVRAAAGVRMAVAVEAARAWREASEDDEGLPVPEVPEDVRGRFEAVWADAWRAAAAQFTPANEKLTAEVEELREEVEALTGLVGEVEEERDEAVSEVQLIADKLEVATAEVAKRDAALQAAEDRAASLTAERDRLDSRLGDLIARLPALSPTAKEPSGKVT